MNKTSHLSPLTSHLKVVFLGTPEIGALVLGDLLKGGVDIQAVITQPDRPSGRGQIPKESPVKHLALDNKIAVLQPGSKEELTKAIDELKPDLCIVAAYGMIIPEDALKIPKYGMANFHPSLLPLLRGPSPITMAIMCGHQKTGVTIIQVTKEMDAGDILAQKAVKLNGTETTPSLSEKLAHLGAKMILDLIPKIANWGQLAQPQDHTNATFTPIINKTDGKILFQKYHAQNIDQSARAFMPWPGIYTTWKGKKLNLYDLSASVNPVRVEPLQNLAPGEVGIVDSKIAIGTTKGFVLVSALMLEGKKKISAKEFVSGYQDFVGSVLE